MNQDELNYVSLFSGIGGFELAILQIFPNARCLASCEIEPNCKQILQRHFPDHPECQDVKSADFKHLRGHVDLVVGGSPCKDLSKANTFGREGLAGAQSSLFWDFVRCVQECRPKYFILENVSSMRGEDKDIITKALGVEPVMLNASAVTCQKRKRLFWCNFFVAPFPAHSVADDSKDKYGVESKATRARSGARMENADSDDDGGANEMAERFLDSTLHRFPSEQNPYSRFLTVPDVLEPKSAVANLGHSQRMLDYLFDDSKPIKGHKPGTSRLAAFPYYYRTSNVKERCVGYYIGRGSYDFWIDERFRPTLYRKGSPREYERMMGLPDDWTEGVAHSQRLKAIGNAVVPAVIVYILHWLALNMEQT